MEKSSLATANISIDARRISARWRALLQAGWLAPAAMALASLGVLFTAYRRFWTSDIWELAASIQDDSFYYLLPAFNLHTHGFFTYDGVNPTYGFQPAYEILTSLCGFAFDDLHRFLRFVLSLNATFHCLTAVIIFASIDRAGRKAAVPQCRTIALLSGLLYLCNVPVILAALTGKENALAAFVLALCLYVVTAPTGRRADRSAILAPLGFGCLLGLLLITRILPTTMLLVGLMLAVALQRYRRPMPLIAGALAPPVLWAGFALVTFGRILPVSGSIKSADLGSGGALLGLMETRFTDCLHYLLSVLEFSAGLPNPFSVPEPDAWIAAGVLPNNLAYTVLQLCAGCLAFTGLAHAMIRRSAIIGIRLMLAFMALSLVGYCAIAMLVWKSSLVYYFSWYVYDMPVLLALTVGFVALEGSAALARFRFPAPAFGLPAYIAGAFVVGAIVTSLTPLPVFTASVHRWSEVSITAAFYLRDTLHLKPDELVASRSCGILGFVLPFNVINMDGLANDAAFHHLDQDRFADTYLRQLKPRYYVDANSLRTQHVLSVFAPDLTIVRTLEFPELHGYTIARFTW